MDSESTAVLAEEQAPTRIPTVYNFLIDEMAGYVHADLELGPDGGVQEFGGKLRMSDTGWADFITVMLAGAKIMGDRVVQTKKDLKHGVAN